MLCANCEENINPESDTHYIQTTPIRGGGHTVDEYCSVACLNAQVGFSDAEIESLMREAGYEVPPEYDFEWAGIVQSNIEDLHRHRGDNGEFFLLFEHTERNYDVEVYHKPHEKLFEVVLYTYDMEHGEKMGLEELKKTHTGVMQRALSYAEGYMETVEENQI